jgi:hypothetical protein
MRERSEPKRQTLPRKDHPERPVRPASDHPGRARAEHPIK